MKIIDKTLGTIEAKVDVRRSTVDSFIQEAWSETFDRALTDLELDYLNDHYSAEIQEYAWENGSRDHN